MIIQKEVTGLYRKQGMGKYAGETAEIISLYGIDDKDEFIDELMAWIDESNEDFDDDDDRNYPIHFPDDFKSEYGVKEFADKLYAGKTVSSNYDEYFLG